MMTDQKLAYMLRLTKDMKIEIVEKKTIPPEDAWPFTYQYLKRVVDNPQDYIDHPAKLEWGWLENHLCITFLPSLHLLNNHAHLFRRNFMGDSAKYQLKKLAALSHGQEKQISDMPAAGHTPGRLSIHENTEQIVSEWEALRGR